MHQYILLFKIHLAFTVVSDWLDIQEYLATTWSHRALPRGPSTTDWLAEAQKTFNYD